VLSYILIGSRKITDMKKRLFQIIGFNTCGDVISVVSDGKRYGHLASDYGYICVLLK
jgi:hypothetical protein